MEGWRVGKDTSSRFDSNMSDVLIWKAYRTPKLQVIAFFCKVWTLCLIASWNLWQESPKSECH